jgi:hypothetical protein
MIEIINFVIDRSPQLSTKIVRISASFAVLCTVSIFVVLIIFTVCAINQEFFYPRGTPAWYRNYLDAAFFTSFGIGLCISFVCGIYAAKHFYTKAQLWEVRMFFRNRVNT